MFFGYPQWRQRDQTGEQLRGPRSGCHHGPSCRDSQPGGVDLDVLVVDDADAVHLRAVAHDAALAGSYVCNASTARSA